MGLREYLSTLLVASVLGALIASFAGKAFEKYIKYLSALLLLLLILSPLRSLQLPTLAGDTETAGVASEGESSPKTLPVLAGELAEEQICKALETELVRALGIKEPTVCITIDWTEPEPCIRAIAVWPDERDASEADVISAYLEQLTGVSVTVEQKEVDGASFPNA